VARVNLGPLTAWRPDSFPAVLTAYVFGRAGGVSAAPWRGLNVGGSVGDDPAAVAENRRRLFAAAGRDPASRFDAYQVHGVAVQVADAATPLAVDGATPPPGDILLTDRPERTLFMRFADCTPILLYDPTRPAVALAHAGWQGTVVDVAGTAVRALQAAYGSRPADLLAAIGPAIGAHHYPVGPEVAAAARAAFGPAADRLLRPAAEQVQFDLWAANALALERAGVRQIEVAGICTACEPEIWFSHRAEAGRTGRFGAVLGLASVRIEPQ
jgi:YfiH family protein